MRTLALLVVMAFGSTSIAGAVDLRLGHFAPDGHPCDIAAKQFKNNVESRTKGAVKINLFGNNALGSPPEVLEQVLLGAVDMSLSGQDQIAKHLPFYDVISTPFAFKDYATADKIIDASSGPGPIRSSPRKTSCISPTGSGASASSPIPSSRSTRRPT